MSNKKPQGNISLTEVVHDTLWKKECITKLAKHLGKSTSTISQQLSPHCDHTCFSADNILPAMEVANDDTPLHWLAEQRGKICIPILESKDSKCAFELLINKSAKEFADFVHVFHDIIDDGKIEGDEPDRFDKEADELIRVVAFMKEAVRSVAGTGTLPKEILLSRIVTDETDRKQ